MAGRPTDYDETIIPRTLEYINQCIDTEEDYIKSHGKDSQSLERLIRVKLPTIEGLAVYLNVNKTTIYEWESKSIEFSNVLAGLRSKQAETLINKGLSGDYNPIIAKLLLMKHGYAEKTETDVTSKGEKLSSPTSGEDIEEIAKRVSEELKAKKLQ